MGKAKGRAPTRVKDAIRKVEEDGWRQKRRGATGHRHYIHPEKSGKVTIAGNPGEEIDPDTLKSIKAQMGVTQEEWDEL